MYSFASTGTVTLEWMLAPLAGEYNVGNLLKASRKKVLTFHYQFQMAELEMLHFVEYNIYLTGWDNKLVRLTSSITSSPTPRLSV